MFRRNPSASAMRAFQEALAATAVRNPRRRNPEDLPIAERLSAFFAAFEAATVRCPVDPDEDARMFPDVPVTIILTREPGDDYVSLVELHAHPGIRGTGVGTEAMRRLLDLADKHDVIVSLIPAPLDKGWSSARLQKWYASFGFEFLIEDPKERKEEGDYTMLRMPEAKGSRRPNPRFGSATTLRPGTRLRSLPAPQPATFVSSVAFQRWFGDSKVVDAQGLPRVVYHGTNDVFSAFDPTTTGRNSWQKWGFSFSSDVNTARTYGQTVLPVYLSLQRPLVLDARGHNWDDIPGVGSINIAGRRAKEEGYDGLIVRNVSDSGIGGSTKTATTFVAFEPTQIKSATGNAGTFDPTDPDIYRNPRRRRNRSRR